MIEIYLSEFYNRPALYPCIPPAIFDALEHSFIAGRETACVSVGDYNRMMDAIREHGLNINDYETNDTHIQHAIRPTAVF